MLTLLQCYGNAVANVENVPIRSSAIFPFTLYSLMLTTVSSTL